MYNANNARYTHKDLPHGEVFAFRPLWVDERASWIRYDLLLWTEDIDFRQHLLSFTYCSRRRLPQYFDTFAPIRLWELLLGSSTLRSSHLLSADAR